MAGRCQLSFPGLCLLGCQLPPEPPEQLGLWAAGGAEGVLPKAPALLALLSEGWAEAPVGLSPCCH